MAFSLFGKRDKPDPPTSTSPELQEPKRGLFDRMKEAVTRTRESFTESISSVIALTREVDETTLVNLEPLLLAGVVLAAERAALLHWFRQQPETPVVDVIRTAVAMAVQGMAKEVNP